MAVSQGTETYVADIAPVRARGLSYTDAELDEALSGDVADVVYDTSGTTGALDLLASVATTDFEAGELRKILEEQTVPEDWRVGEALAQVFLTQHRKCEFPWPASRDLRNPVSSPAGTDLVGFSEMAASVKFAFGEVKTSGQAQWPPSLMYGRHGLKKQMEELRDSFEVRDALFRYLVLHATGATWEEKFKTAATAYVKSKTNVVLFGVLIRDVVPSADDLKARAAALADSCPADMTIELYGFYMPADSIPTLPTRCKKQELPQ